MNDTIVKCQVALPLFRKIREDLKENTRFPTIEFKRSVSSTTVYKLHNKAWKILTHLPFNCMRSFSYTLDSKLLHSDSVYLVIRKTRGGVSIAQLVLNTDTGFILSSNISHMNSLAGNTDTSAVGKI